MRRIGVATGLVAAVSLATTSAGADHSAASPFEVVVAGVHEAVPASEAYPFGFRHAGPRGR